MKKLLRAVIGVLMLASIAHSGWAQPALPNWVGSTPAFNWQPRLGGVYWLDSRAVVKQAAPYLTQSSRPVLVDIKTDATGFGYRFDLNSWDPHSAIYSYYPWNGTDAGTPASPEDALQIFGATSNAQFILNIPIPLNLTSTPTSNWGYDGYGYTWQTPQFYAAMVQYLTGVAGPQSEWQNLATNLNFFSQPTNFNWADLRAARGHVNPYPVVAFIIGSEPYNIEGTPTGALYGPQAERFRIAIRNAGYTGPLGLHVHDMGYVDDPTTEWFWPMMSSLTASDFSFMDLEHYYQFSTVLEDFKRSFPVSVNPNAAYWMPQSTWKSDYTKFLWIVQDTRNAIRDDGAVSGLGNSNRWQLGWSEHGIQVTSEFIYNDMFSAMHWAGWVAESMRQNIAWDSAWTVLAEGFSTAQIQVYNGYATRTPMFYVYQMAQDFYGYNYLTNSYVSPTESTTNNIGDPVEYPSTSARVFSDPATGNIHLFVVNQSTNASATLTGFESWNVVGWKQLTAGSYTNSNPLGVPGPEPIQTQSAALPAPGSSLVIPPISVNHIILSASASAPTNSTPPTVAMVTPANGATVSGSTSVTATASDNVGVTSLQFKLDGANLGSVFTSAPYSETLDTTTLANGSHTLTATAADAAGNQTTATPVAILVSNAVIVLGLPTVTVAATAPTAVIGTTNYAVLTFTCTGAASQALTVNFTLGGTAVKWNDYRRPVQGDMPTSITIPAGSNSYAMEIAGEANSTGANPETAIVTLAAGTNYTVGTPSGATITITSNVVVTLPTVTVAATVPTATIGTTNEGAITFTRTGNTNNALTINYALGGTAVQGTDYGNLTLGTMPTSITIPAGASSYTLEIAGMANSTGANPETASITLSANAAYTSGTPNSAMITILTNPVVTLPTITVAATVPTAVIGTTNYGAFTFTRTGGTSSALTVNYTLAGTAVKWDDYRRPVQGDMPVTIAIPAGASSYVMNIAGEGNQNNANPETAILTLSTATNYTVGASASATITITTNLPAANVRSTITMAGNSMKIAWNSVVGKTYCIAYKNNLTDAAWTPLNSSLIATATSTSFTDSSISGVKQRFYIVYATD